MNTYISDFCEVAVAVLVSGSILGAMAVSVQAMLLALGAW